ncbi:MAG: PD-(D/E)XK nuclease family protein [Clostridiaceae bacterium]
MENKDLFELENDISFQKLNQQVNAFNVLKVLRLEGHEIRHSNILAWLLNPKENHSLQDYFFRKILETLILIEENSNNLKCGLVEAILNNSLMGSQVYREVKTHNNRFIDLVIINQQLKLVVFIDNKIYSTESQNQLDDYLAFVEEKFQGFKIIPIYLTLQGEEPSNKEYFILTHEKIEGILNTILMLQKNQLSADVYCFIKDYQQVLKDLFYPNKEQILQAITLYRSYSSVISSLFEEIPSISKLLSFNSGYKTEFVMKYRHTIDYIFKHGKNIISYSFEDFIQSQFNGQVLHNVHPTVPSLLPPEWEPIVKMRLREESYWLGTGLVVWFEQGHDSRLRLIVEVGPIEYESRLALLEKLQESGLSIKEKSKQEGARYTRIFTKAIDINNWNDKSDLTQGMLDLYNSSEFTSLKNRVAAILNNNTPINEEITKVIGDRGSHRPEEVPKAFESFMRDLKLTESHYRISSKHLSFVLPLFDSFKEKLGETREKWWWHNGPFLIWYGYDEASLYFTLEVGPIEGDMRVLLMEAIKEKGIRFNKKGLNQDAKLTHIYSKKVSINGLDEAELLKTFHGLYYDTEFQSIIEKLQSIYDETISKIE